MHADIDAHTNFYFEISILSRHSNTNVRIAMLNDYKYVRYFWFKVCCCVVRWNTSMMFKIYQEEEWILYRECLAALIIVTISVAVCLSIHKKKHWEGPCGRHFKFICFLTLNHDFCPTDTHEFIIYTNVFVGGGHCEAKLGQILGTNSRPSG